MKIKVKKSRHRFISAKKNSDYTQSDTIEKKPLFLIMQKKYFDQIEKGQKKKEFRDFTEHYISRLCNRDKAGEILSIKKYKYAVLQEGYNRGARRLICEIGEISFNGEIFTININEVLERMNF